MLILCEIFLVIIFSDFKVDLNEKECIKRMSKTFLTFHPSHATILFRWFREFKHEKFDLKGEVECLHLHPQMKILKS